MLIDAKVPYDAAKILQQFQSNIDYSQNNDFITFCELNRRTTSIRPIIEYDKSVETKLIEILEEIDIQIDFYGKNAIDAASNFFNYLMGLASSYLHVNYPLITIGVVQTIHNMTNYLDRSTYMQRYVLRFSVFMINNIVADQPMSGIKPTITFFQ